MKTFAVHTSLHISFSDHERNHGRCVLRPNEKKDRSDCYQNKVQKPVSVMVWGRVCAHGININAERQTDQSEHYNHRQVK